jgi:Icc-related predicted phosphoesterase
VEAGFPTHAVLLALLSAACGPLQHVPTEPRLLYGDTGRAGATLPPGAGPRLRVVAYGDTRGNREIHRAVVAAIAEAKPDLVIFTGDALDCLPVGHMPDYGGWQYLVPLWPQVHRGYPVALIASVIPFPALIHQTLGAPFAPPRDARGLNAFLEDTAPLRDAGVPLLFAPGNHDLYHRADREEVARHLGYGVQPERSPERLWYSTDAAGWRFVVLDTGTDLFGDGDPMPAGGPQLAWLDAQLADAERGGLPVVVVLHMPPFSSGREEGSVPWVRERVVEGVLDRHRVALVLSGHAHAYERLEQPGQGGRLVTYVVTGGGGAFFFHEADEPAPGSRIFLQATAHYVLLDLSPAGIAGRMVPVAIPAAEGTPPPREPTAGDAFEIAR